MILCPSTRFFISIIKDEDYGIFIAEEKLHIMALRFLLFFRSEKSKNKARAVVEAHYKKCEEDNARIYKALESGFIPDPALNLGVMFNGSMSYAPTPKMMAEVERFEQKKA